MDLHYFCFGPELLRYGDEILPAKLHKGYLLKFICHAAVSFLPWTPHLPRSVQFKDYFKTFFSLPETFIW